MVPPLLAAGALQYVFGILMFLSAVFLILLVLVQRGRGGGLAGALGGMGGQSAFGTKAGDTFTKFTIAIASFWILLCMAAVIIMSGPSNKIGGVTGTAMPDAAARTELPGNETPRATEDGNESVPSSDPVDSSGTTPGQGP